ncbi:MAG: UbiA family prenyltransferase [Candidatus Bathyarchaeota archaeon]|nr:MAG: UbiA family prenyltransferase [Candidatus Bathyarchaeota archaeon]
MLKDVKGFATFISAERGLMLFMISMGSTLLLQTTLSLEQAVYFGLLGFCGWSSVDAINNIYDIDLDEYSDSSRAAYTKKLGRWGIGIYLVFSCLALGGAFYSGNLITTLMIGLGLVIGILYSVPPFRLRQTLLKPIVNFSVGAIPVLFVAGFYNLYSVNVIALMILIGVTTAVNSLWEDLADFVSDSESGAKTLLIVLGFRRGLFLTILLGYCLIPLMVYIGFLFQLHFNYYIVLSLLVAYMTGRVISKRESLGSCSDASTIMLEIGEVFAKDFVLLAVVQTSNLMVNGLIQYF